MEKETMQMDPCNVFNRSFWKLFFRNKIQKLNHFRISRVARKGDGNTNSNWISFSDWLRSQLGYYPVVYEIVRDDNNSLDTVSCELGKLVYDQTILFLDKYSKQAISLDDDGTTGEYFIS